ncbi:helix-turn-helix domain-containing protein [Streptomyces lunalinharesii]|uniref:Transposase n=1 Tax=Streptomyces lunalinharesii TaxID=333384 RepID=A0ABP6FGA8_9ACTN
MAYGHKTGRPLRVRAQIALNAARGRSNARIAREIGLHVDTVRCWRSRFAEHGLPSLADRSRSSRSPAFSSLQATQVKTPACQPPAESGGVPLSRWSAPELAREAMARGIVTFVSASTVRRWLGRDAPKPWQYHSWIFTASAVWRAFELRAHLVDAPPGLPLHDSGWQISADRPPHIRIIGRQAQALSADSLTSTFVSIIGHTDLLVAAAEGTSAFARHTAIPYATSRRTTARTVHVALVGLTGRDADPTPPAVRCAVDGTTITAGFPDGTRILISLGAAPARSPVLDGVSLPGPVRYARLSPEAEPVIIPGRVSPSARR